MGSINVNSSNERFYFTFFSHPPHFHLGALVKASPLSPSLAPQPCCPVSPSQMVDQMGQRMACRLFLTEQSTPAYLL